MMTNNYLLWSFWLVVCYLYVDWLCSSSFLRHEWLDVTMYNWQSKTILSKWTDVFFSTAQICLLNPNRLLEKVWSTSTFARKAHSSKFLFIDWSIASHLDYNILSNLHYLGSTLGHCRWFLTSWGTYILIKYAYIFILFNLHYTIYIGPLL